VSSIIYLQKLLPVDLPIIRLLLTTKKNTPKYGHDQRPCLAVFEVGKVVRDRPSDSHFGESPRQNKKKQKQLRCLHLLKTFHWLRSNCLITKLLPCGREQPTLRNLAKATWKATG